MRVLLYAPVDLNLIDGSAIWCVSVAQMLGQDDRIHVDILRHTPPRRDINLQALTADSRFRLLDPWGPGDPAALPAGSGKLGPRLTPEQAFECIANLHAANPYDLLIPRGGPICRLVAGSPRLAARSWFYLTQHGADFETVAVIAASNGRVACQTPLLQQYLEGLLGTAPDRYVPLPPMVPRLPCAGPRAGRPNRRLCYVGKFDPHYLVEEMIAGLAELRERFADAEFVIAGDKFHDPRRSGEFEQRLTAALRGTPGVDWRGGMPREQVGQLMADCAVGSCWRDAHYDDSLELSTKVLEYAAAGLPVLLNPTRVNRLVFGEDYPLYVDSAESFRARLAAVFGDEALYTRAAELAFETSRRFTFAAVNQQLQPYLSACQPRGSVAAQPRGPRRLLFASHDFKFCQDIIEQFEARPDCVVRLDEWDGHTIHNERRSAELLQWADVVWCEWCLGNAVWYSARARPAQRLVVRLHRQEITTEHPDCVTWSNVDHLVLIAPHVRDMVLGQLGPDAVRDARLVFNTFDCERFAIERPAGGEFLLGLLGYCPRLKNPRLALEILQHLVEDDDRWRLLLTGRPPREYAWLWERPDERQYYEELERYIADAGLEPRLIRQDWTDDPAGWYAGVGYLLSCSDLEGSHQAVAEGMAAGCVPVVRRWYGADQMYPNSLLFNKAIEAARLIRACQGGQHDRLGRAAREEARRRFDLSVITPQLVPLLLGPTSNTEPMTADQAIVLEARTCQSDPTRHA